MRVWKFLRFSFCKNLMISAVVIGADISLLVSSLAYSNFFFFIPQAPTNRSLIATQRELSKILRSVEQIQTDFLQSCFISFPLWRERRKFTEPAQYIFQQLNCHSILVYSISFSAQNAGHSLFHAMTTQVSRKNVTSLSTRGAKLFQKLLLKILLWKRFPFYVVFFLCEIDAMPDYFKWWKYLLLHVSSCSVRSGFYSERQKVLL